LNDIKIIDYGSGNLLSIYDAFKKIGVKTTITSNKDELREADAIILPGVGSFGAVMKNLTEYEDVLHEHIDDSKALLGICLGLHVLFTDSEESSNMNGLNIFKGSVKRFNLSEDMKIPHMGWNDISINKENVDILSGCDNKYMYFVHSYYIQPEDKNIISAYTDYGGRIPVAIGKDNIHALQFHPEKSGEYGLKILENFISTI